MTCRFAARLDEHHECRRYDGTPLHEGDECFSEMRMQILEAPRLVLAVIGESDGGES